MASDDFRSWLDNMRALGYGEAEIRQSLQEKGWTERQIDELLGPVVPATVSVAPPPGVGTTELPPPPPVPQILIAPPVSPVAVAPPVPPAPGAYRAPTSLASAPPAGSSALATWALITGILGLLPLVDLLAAPLAIIFGAVSMARRRPGQGMAVAGLIMGVVGIIMLPFWLVMSLGAWTAFGGALRNPTLESYSRDWKEWTPKPDEDQPATAEAGAGDKTSANPEETCLSNERAVLSAMRLYTEDNETALPEASGWPEATQEYLGDDDPWRCPADQRETPQEQDDHATSYTMYEPMGGTLLSSFQHGGLDQAYVLFDGAVIAGDESMAAYRHRDGLSLGYADGHCAWVPRAVFLNPPD
jgi:hypothetical protein